MASKNLIIVIADDLTGAAELGGIALKYGLRTAIDVNADPGPDTDVLVICTDTRSMNEADAVDKIDEICSELVHLNPAFIYKKIDSVLRGHILAEIAMQAKIFNLHRTLIIAANPALGRTIAGGSYWLHNSPVHLSGFSKDPEFPIHSSAISDMLRAEELDEIYVLKAEEDLPETGIIVGEVTSTDDLQNWVPRIGQEMVIAGAAGFFDACLSRMYAALNTGQNNVQLQQPTLYVCGSNFNKTHELIKAVKDSDGPVSYMPSAILHHSSPLTSEYDLWVKEVVSFLKTSGKAIIAIDPLMAQNVTVSALDLRTKMAHIAAAIFNKIPVKELVLEGGSTAAAVLHELGHTRFIPVQQFGQGLIRMQAASDKALHITLKPGSYAWTAGVWKF